MRGNEKERKTETRNIDNARERGREIRTRREN